jgi:CTD small phosphatase-like protein 2
METGQCTKDLNRLGRDLSKTIIIDNLAENFRLTPDNGIRVDDFIDDFHDQTLNILREFLLKVAKNGVEDVREVLCKYRDRWSEY